jgi:hypothetical protein
LLLVHNPYSSPSHKAAQCFVINLQICPT